MDLSNYYLHSIRDSEKYPSRLARKTFEKILKNDNILSRRLLEYKSDYVLFNGLDYISLCDPAKSTTGESAYNEYAVHFLTLVLSKNINVINTEKLDIPDVNIKDEKLYINSKTRYSNFKDEVQAKDSISTSNIVALTIPISNMISRIFTNSTNAKFILKELEILKKILLKYKLNTPIYDIETLTNIDSEENIEKAVLKIIKTKHIL